MNFYYILGLMGVSVTFLVLVGLGFVDFYNMASMSVVGGGLIGISLYVLSFEDSDGEEKRGRGTKSAFREVNRLLSELERGEPITFKGGENVQIDTKYFRDGDDKKHLHTAIFGRTVRNRLPLLVIYSHDENRITRLKYNPSRERQDMFFEYEPYSVNNKKYDRYSDGRRNDDRFRRGRRGSRSSNSGSRSGYDYNKDLDRISEDLVDKI